MTGTSSSSRCAIERRRPGLAPARLGAAGVLALPHRRRGLGRRARRAASSSGGLSRLAARSRPGCGRTTRRPTGPRRRVVVPSPLGLRPRPPAVSSSARPVARGLGRVRPPSPRRLTSPSACSSSARRWTPAAVLVAHGQRRRPRPSSVLVELGEDHVHLVAHPVHRRRHLVARRAQLLDLHPERAPPRRQVGQHPSARLLDLLEQGPALVLGPRDDRLALGHRVGEDALALDPRFLLGVGHEELDFDHTLGRRCLRARLELVHLALRVTQQGGRPLLGLRHDPRRLFMGVAQDLRAVLAERRRQGGFVEHGVGRPLLGFGQRMPAAPARSLRALRGCGPPTGGRPGPRRCRTPAGPLRRSAGRCPRWRSGTRRWGHGLLPWSEPTAPPGPARDWWPFCSAPCPRGA